MFEYKVTDKVELFPQKGGWHFIRIPAEISSDLSYKANRGLIPIEAQLGKTQWTTSLLPMGDGTHFIPLKAAVRQKEKVYVDDIISISFKPH